MHHPKQHGFTLIEMLIVVTVIAILASMAIPNLLASRVTTNESVVIGALRSIVTAQLQCQSRAIVDLDGDGRGEALGLDELCGIRPLRSGAGTLNPPALPQSLGILDAQGNAPGRGYLLRLCLPDAGGAGIPATAANANAVNADHAEIYWTCVAWPQSRAVTGNATFFTNQTGDILKTIEGNYDGATNVPPAGAALTGSAPNQILGATPATTGVAADGNRWTIVR
jgi:prepilin-type N-terminal cleavage/methylation domain-containing protein